MAQSLLVLPFCPRPNTLKPENYGLLVPGSSRRVFPVYQATEQVQHAVLCLNTIFYMYYFARAVQVSQPRVQALTISLNALYPPGQYSL